MATGKNWRSQIQSDYKYKSELQNLEGKKSVLCIASAWWNRARHKWHRDHRGYCVCVVKPSTTPMTTWPPRPRTPSTQRTWTAVLLVSQVRVVMIHIALHGSSVAYVIPCMMSVSLRPWVLHSLVFPHLPIHLFLHFLPRFFRFLEGRSEPVHSAEKGMDSLDETYSLTVNEPNAYDLKGDLRRNLHRVPDLTAVLQARVSRGRRVRWHRTPGYAARSTRSTCLSLPARRLVCLSVAVCVRKNGATCWRANGATCWIVWSGAKRCKCTD